MLKLFISKHESEVEELAAFCTAKNIELTAKSLIEFESIDFEIKEPFDIIFFSSPRSVMFFLRSQSLPKDTVIATVGKTTGKLLKELGYNPVFEGEGSDPESIAEAFELFAKDKRILFPLSEQSLRSISSRLPSDRIEEIRVYRTCPKQVNIEPQDYYVFTSPSNFEAFFSSNSFSEHAHIISWGKSTFQAIKSKGFENKILPEPGISELINMLDPIL